jgi:beta-lactamase regulating signal transducer with metallopeptidase domain
MMTDLFTGLPANSAAVVLLLAKVTLILSGAGLATLALRRASAGLRHLVWSAAVVASVALPVLALVSPWHWQIPLLSPAPAAAPRTSLTTRQLDVTGPAPTIHANAGTASPLAPATNPESLTSSNQSSSQAFADWSLEQKLLALWLAGAGLIALRLMVGWLLVARVVRRAVPLTAPEWQRPLIDVADRLALPRLPGLYLSNRLPMPFACGFVTPAIVLPAEAGEWPAARRQAVLCHELAHLHRRDLLLNLIAQSALALFWFHPLMWVAVRRIRIESERACDDLVLGTGTRASEYADHLLQILRAVPRFPVPAAVLPFAERGEFEGRVLAILEAGARREPASRRGAVTVTSLVLLVVAPLAILVPVRRAEVVSTEPWPAQLIAPVSGHAPSETGSRPEATPRSSSKPQVIKSPSTPVGSSDQTVATAKAGSEEKVAPDTGDVSIVVRSLMTALSDTVPAVRENAAYSLGRLGAASAVPSLARLVERDPSAAVREMSAWALGTLRGREGVSGLSAAVQRDTAASVRATAVWALAQLDLDEAIPAVTAALRDKVVEVRSRAAWAIGSIRPATAPGALLQLASDTASEVRMRAAWAMGQIRDSAAVPALSRLVQDPSKDVREAAFWALGNQEGSAAEAALLKALEAPDPALRAQAARSLSGARNRPWPWPWPWPR